MDGSQAACKNWSAEGPKKFYVFTFAWKCLKPPMAMYSATTAMQRQWERWQGAEKWWLDSWMS